MYIKRQLSDRLKQLSQLYSAILISGPRQSGKTSLARQEFPDHDWVLLDRPSVKDQAIQDPGLFLKSHPFPVILDEIQQTKGLLAELKYILDTTSPPKASYILTGSQPFTIIRDVGESLAGRVGILELPPLCLSEVMEQDPVPPFNQLIQSPPLNKDFSIPRAPAELILRGFFPAMALEAHSPGLDDATQRIQDYIQTYLTRDLREMLLLKNIAGYEGLLRHLALYAAQPLNISAIARECGIKQSTASEWISLLEASYLYQRIPGFHRKLGRRESQRPKGVFVDSGLTASLLGLDHVDQITRSPLIGRLFESMAINLLSRTLGYGKNLYHWRMDEKTEIDLLIEFNATTLVPIEIKMSSRPSVKDCESIQIFMDRYPEAKNGLLVSLHDSCFWVTDRILHIPLAML